MKFHGYRDDLGLSQTQNARHILCGDEMLAKNIRGRMFTEGLL